MAKVIVNRQSRSTLLLSISPELRTKAYWLVSGELKFCMARLHETSRRDEKVRDPRRDAETFWAETETRPRPDVSTSRDGLETETSRPIPHPWRRAYQPS